jgi:hypothetical protein
MSKGYPVFRRFTRDVTIVSFGLSVLVIGIVAYLSSQARRDISEHYIHNVTERAGEQFSAMQREIETFLRFVREYGASGLLPLSDPGQVRKQLQPVFKKAKLLAGISVGDNDGRSYFILPDGSERKPSDARDYDPRRRPWFRPAQETDGVYWTEQYRFHTLQQIGITASASYVPLKGPPAVVAFDVLLDDLYRELKKLAPTPGSDVVAFRRNELLLVPESGSAASQFVSVDSVTNPLIRSAHDSWSSGRGMSAGDVVSFLHDGEVWWCGFRPLDNSRRNVWMGVLVPESDIDGDISRRRRFIWIFGLAAILVAAGVAFGLSRRYGRSFMDAAPFDPDQAPASVRRLIERGENRAVEFKSTMRMNLHAKKPGKEIELAWLKGVAAFLNTDGGTVLLGVTDAGEITGLERDVFENEDKCRLHFKNLIAAHIGAELSKYIRFFLVPMDGKTVGVVSCARSSEPVFLKDGNKEAFYIRNGPSSDELPVSKALKYIKNRK